MTDFAADWLRCREYLLPTIERTGGTHTERDVVDGLLSGELTLWPSERSALVTEFIQYPRLKVMNWFLAVGDLDEILDMENDICDWAKENGCDRVMVMGRKGWKKALPEYREQWVVLTKEL